MKEHDWRDMVLTFLPTLALTLPRQMYLVLVLAYLKLYALILLALEAILLMIVASFYFKNDRSKAIMGAIASIFGPCFRVDEMTKYYLATGLTSGIYSFLSMLLLPMYHVYEDTLFNSTVSEPPLLANNRTEIPLNGLTNYFENHHLFGMWYFLAVCMIWSISLASTVFLHFYMKLSFRLKISKALHLHLFRTSFFTPIWPTSELIWYPLTNGILANKDYYEKANGDAKKYLGKSILGYSLTAGYDDIVTVRK